MSKKSKYAGGSKRKQEQRRVNRRADTELRRRLSGHSEGRISGAGPGHFVVFDALSEPRHGESKFAPAFTTHDYVTVDLAAAEERILAGIKYDGIHNVINAAPLSDIYAEPFQDTTLEKIAEGIQAVSGCTMREARKRAAHEANYGFHRSYTQYQSYMYWDNAKRRDWTGTFEHYERYSWGDMGLTHAEELLRHTENDAIELTPGKDFHPTATESRERPALPALGASNAYYIEALKQRGYEWVAGAEAVKLYGGENEEPFATITREEWNAAQPRKLSFFEGCDELDAILVEANKKDD